MTKLTTTDGVKFAREYLETGGLGEVIGLASIARQYDQPKVQMDTDMAIALCDMASELLSRKQAQ